MKNSNESLKDLVRNIQLATGLTQAEIAERAEYNRAYLSQIMASGNAQRVIAKISKVFKVVLEGGEMPIPGPENREQEDYKMKYIEILELKAKDESEKLNHIANKLNEVRENQQLILKNQELLNGILDKVFKKQ